MQSYHRVLVQFKKKDRQEVAEMLRKGRKSALVLRRASILRPLDSGQKAAQGVQSGRSSERVFRAP